jgi:hypothetical protein
VDGFPRPGGTGMEAGLDKIHEHQYAMSRTKKGGSYDGLVWGVGTEVRDA